MVISADQERINIEKMLARAKCFDNDSNDPSPETHAFFCIINDYPIFLGTAEVIIDDPENRSTHQRVVEKLDENGKLLMNWFLNLENTLVVTVSSNN